MSTGYVELPNGMVGQASSINCVSGPAMLVANPMQSEEADHRSLKMLCHDDLQPKCHTHLPHKCKRYPQQPDIALDQARR